MICTEQVFEPGVLPEKCCCLASFYDHIYVGTKDGRVCLFTIGRDETNELLISDQLKPVDQLVSLGEIGLVFALCNGVLETIDAQRLIPRNDAKIVLKEKVVCVAFNEDAQPDFGLCVATSHKLHLYRWAGERHEPWKTLNVTSTPMDLAWSRHTFCVAMEDHIALIDMHSQSSRKVHEFPRRSTAFETRRAKVKALTGGRFLMCIDSLGIIIKNTGEPSGNTLVWPSPPLMCTCTLGFVVTLHGDGESLEVHSIGTSDSADVSSMIQETHTLPVPANYLLAPAPWNAIPGPKGKDQSNLEDLAAGGGILILCNLPPVVYRLGTISLKKRLGQLFQKLDITSAFKLFEQRVLSKINFSESEVTRAAKLVSLKAFDTDDLEVIGSTREALIQKFYADAGIAVLKLGNVELAFKQFAKGKVDPRELLYYYENLQEPGKEFPFSPKLLRPIMLFSGIPSSPSEKSGGNALEDGCQLFKLMPKSNQGAKVLLYEELFKYMLQHKHENELVDMGLFYECLLLLDQNDFDKTRYKQELEKLVGEPNNLLDAEKHAEILKSKQFYHAAALLYGTSAEHRRHALQIWADLGSGKFQEPGHDGIEETINFFATYGESIDEELLWIFSAWILEKAPRRGLKMFTYAQFPEQGKDKLDKIIKHLRSYDPELRYMLCLDFLSLLSQHRRDYDVDLGIEFIKVLEKAPPNRFEELRIKFHDFASGKHTLVGKRKGTSSYKAELVIRKIDQSKLKDKLSVVKVELYGKCEWHDHALDILVNQLGNAQAAEQYCIKVYENMDKEEEDVNETTKKNPFLDLLCIYFTPENSSKFKEASLGILERHGQRIDPTAVVSKLPADLPVQELQLYLSIMFAHNVEVTSQLRIGKNLYVGHNFKVRNQLMRKHKHNITITKDTRCRHCNKPIQTSAFALDPTHTYVMHLSCHKENGTQSLID